MNEKTLQIKSPDDVAPDDYCRNRPLFQGENFQKNLGRVKKLEEIAQEKNCTPGQLALAWVLAQGDELIPIPGTKRIKYLDENINALSVTLTPDDLHRIDEAAPVGVADGTRYPEAMMARVGL